MKKVEDYEIQLEKSNDKGMFNFQSIKNFLLKAKNEVFKIKLSGGYGTEFFCKIQYKENDYILLPVLITCNNVLKKDVIVSQNDIKLIFNDGKEFIISLKEARKKWVDKKMDFTIIEIKKNDDIEEYFQLDDILFEKNYSNENYLGKKAIIYGIDPSQRIGFSNRKYKKIFLKCFSSYTCNTYPGCSGGYIVKQNNNSAISIHIGGDQN